MAGRFEQFKKSPPVQAFARWWRGAARDQCYGVLRRLSPVCSRIGPVKGMFSAYTALCDKKVPGEIVLRGQELRSAAPNSLRRLARLDQDKHQPWPIFWTRHDGARLLGPSALLVNDRKLACQEAMFTHHFRGDRAFYSLCPPEPVDLAGEWTSLMSCWGLSGNYYHWMLDNLPRLALLDRLPPRTHILVPPQLRAYQVESLRWLGVEDRFRPVTEPHLRIENFYFSTPTAMTGCPNPYAVKFLRERFLPRADPAGPAYEKIYIQRRSKTRGIMNESDVAAFLQERGWTVVDPETLTLAQQINLFQKARAICGAHGAGFTNLLWCQPDVVAIELLASNYLNGCYESLAECVAAQHRYLVMEGDDQLRANVDLHQLGRLLPD